MAIAAVRRYCEARVPPEHLDEVRVEFAVRGRSVSIYECRAPWDDDFGPEWTAAASPNSAMTVEMVGGGSTGPTGTAAGTPMT